MSANAGKILAEVGLDLGPAEAALGSFGRLLSGIGAGIEIDLGRRLLDLGGDLAMAGVKAAHFADDFDRSMIQAAALLPPVAGGATALRKGLEDLAQTTPVALGDLAKGLVDVARTGAPSAAGAMEKLAAATKLARISGTDLGEAIHTLDQAMDAFGVPVSKAADVVDILATAGKHAVSLQELAPILERVGAQAQAAGIPLEQTVAAIVALVETGVPVKQAGAIFTQSLGGVVAEGDDASIAATRLGVKLSVVGGQLQFSGRGADIFAQALAGMQGRAGEADRQLKDLSGTLGDQEAIIKNRLLIAWADFGRSVTPIIEKLLRATAGFVDFLTGTQAARDMTGQLRELAGGFNQVAEAERITNPKLMGAGFDRIDAALKGLGSSFRAGFGAVNIFRDAIKDMPTQELPALADALASLTEEQRQQLGITQQQVNEMLHLIGVTQQAARAAAGVKPPGEKKGGPVTPPISTDLQKALKAAGEDLAGLNTVAKLLGPTFNQDQAEADALASAINRIVGAGGTASTVVPALGQTVGQLAERYRTVSREVDIARIRQDGWQRLLAQAGSVIESVMTPQEAFAQGQAELNVLFSNGLLTLDQYNKALIGLGITTGQVLDLSQALQQGLADAFGTLGTQLGEALQGSDTALRSLGDRILKVLGDTLTAMGHAAVGFGLLGVAMKIFAKNPFAAIAAGVALIALGTALSRSATASMERAANAMSGGGGVGPAAPPPPTQQQSGEAQPQQTFIFEFQDPSNPAVVQRMIASGNRLSARDAAPVVSVPLAVVGTGR